MLLWQLKEPRRVRPKKTWNEFTDVTNVNLTDGISRHGLMPQNVHSLKYNSPSHSTVQFLVPVQTHVRFKVI